MNLTIKKALLATSISLLFIGCANQPEQINTVSNEEIKLEAKKAIMKVGGTLKATLVQKMKEGGPANAAEFCSIYANDLTKEIVKSLPNGVKIKRITDKPRNMNNMATDDQLKVLGEIKEKMDKGNMPAMVVKQLSSNHYQVYKPLKIEAKCLTCHGNADKRNKEAYNIIKEKYPNDKAIDYNIGDLRGAFLVDIIK